MHTRYHSSKLKIVTTFHRPKLDPSPSSYAQVNRVQRQDAEQLLEEYSKIIRWRNNGKENVLDIGCGPGDITIDFVLPRMSRPIGKLVGVDVSEKMIKYAKRLYECEDVHFQTLDIENGDIDLFLKDYPEGFDHITSFYCLQWVRDQKKGMKNIYNLLKPAGDCFFAYPVKHAVFEIYEELAKIPRWNTFMASNCDFFASFINQDNAADTIYKFLKLTGFRYYNVEMVDKRMTYTGLDNILGFITTINPIIPKINNNERTEYLKDFLKIAAELNVYREARNPSESEFATPYQLVVAYAVK
ncbi:unnamed protein product [Hermetia illucens]|uniref:Methyltransferase domain-containing protein n=1 Tax=Hermetia illucens TaxID=343691 RepID=A0A7R8UES4_HERIL|nr:juvenile hormone acid O-methyltransferase-like [Hermetia illucens]CAD7079457.1 unnamed protein product [Hermetia illucens]